VVLVAAAGADPAADRAAIVDLGPAAGIVAATGAVEIAVEIGAAATAAGSKVRRRSISKN